MFLEQVVDLQPPEGCVVDRIEQVAEHRKDGERLSAGRLEAISIPGDYGSYAPGPVPDARMVAARVSRDARHGKPILEHGNPGAELGGGFCSRVRRYFLVEQLDGSHRRALNHHLIGRQIVLVSVLGDEVFDELLAILDRGEFAVEPGLGGFGEAEGAILFGCKIGKSAAEIDLDVGDGAEHDEPQVAVELVGTHDLARFKAECDVIATNRWSDDLSDVPDKVCTRDPFKKD